MKERLLLAEDLKLKVPLAETRSEMLKGLNQSSLMLFFFDGSRPLMHLFGIEESFWFYGLKEKQDGLGFRVVEVKYVDPSFRFFFRPSSKVDAVVESFSFLNLSLGDVVIFEEVE